MQTIKKTLEDLTNARITVIPMDENHELLKRALYAYLDYMDITRETIPTIFGEKNGFTGYILKNAQQYPRVIDRLFRGEKDYADAMKKMDGDLLKNTITMLIKQRKIGYTNVTFKGDDEKSRFLSDEDRFNVVFFDQAGWDEWNALKNEVKQP